MGNLPNRLTNRNADRGQALVEMALILPVLILLAMATIDVGRVFSGYLSITNAAREGAAYAARHPNDANLSSDVTNAVTTELNGQIPNAPTVSVDLPAGWTAGSQVTVTVTTTFPLLTTAVFSPASLSLHSQASMMVQCSSVCP